MKPRDRHEAEGGREEELAAYLDGEMAPEQAAEFEARLEADAALRAEAAEWRAAVEAARDWMELEAPGVERVAELALPLIAAKPEERGAGRSPAAARSTPARVFSLRSLAWGTMAAAAIFFAGFYAGQVSQSGAAKPLPGGSATAPAAFPQTPASVTPVAVQATPVPTPRQAPDRARTEVAGVPDQQYTDEHGRLVVETTLKGSGARALWVVDGQFQLAQTSLNH